MLQPIYLTQTRFRNGKGFLIIILAGIVLIGLSSGTGRQRPTPIMPSASLLNQFPLAFVPNVGQTETAIHFTATSQPGTLFFTDDGLQLALPNGQVAVAFVESWV